MVLDRFGVYEREAAPREDVKTEVTASLSPFVGLFCKDRPDEPDDRVAVWEDPNNISATANLAVQALVWVIRPDLLPHIFRERGEREDVSPGSIEVVELNWPGLSSDLYIRMELRCQANTTPNFVSVRSACLPRPAPNMNR